MERFYNISVKPTSEPVTVSEVKLYTRIPHAVEDTLIGQWIEAGRKLAEEYQHRSYIEQTWKLVYDGFPETPIHFPRPPLISVDSFKYYDTDSTEYSFDSSNYEVDIISEPGRLSLLKYGTWPSTILRSISGVIITFTSGYGSDSTYVPSSVKDAIYLYCAHRYENRDAEIDNIPVTFFDILRPDRIEDR